VHLYGSARLGIFNRSINVSLLPNETGMFNFERGNKFFELSNHLGNVLVTISDKKIGVDVAPADGIIDYYTADVVTANDYYPFGMTMPGRKYTQPNSSYRYGFNGKENDNEVKGEGNQQDYGLRIYDPRLGRFLSVDPLGNQYPWNSVYSYAEGDPINYIDLDGGEKPATTAAATVGIVGDPIIKQVTKTVIEKGTDLAVDATGKMIKQSVKESLGKRAINWLGSTAGKAGGLFVYFMLSSFETNGGENGWIKDQQLRRMQQQPQPQLQPQPQPRFNPREKPSPEDDGEQGFYVYKTASTDKIRTGIVDKSAGSIPYYGITSNGVIGGRCGRYKGGNERAVNLTVGQNGIIAKTNYYTAGGIESAIIILNTYGASSLNTKSLKSLIRNSPALSTRIDNKTITFTNPAQILSGVLWLNKNLTGWQTLLKEKENKKGPAHPVK